VRRYSLPTPGIDEISEDFGTIEVMAPMALIDNVSPSVAPFQSMLPLMLLTLLVGLPGLIAVKRS
jgi:hypothetical protein